MANGRKHQQVRLRTYLQTHGTVFNRFVTEGFILSNQRLEIDFDTDPPIMEGEIECVCGLRITVTKVFTVERQKGKDPLIRTEAYSYNVSLSGIGNVFRYCSPHPDESIPHHAHHHRHRYDVWAGDESGTIDVIRDGETVPTLGEVLEEARRWMNDNHGLLHERGLCKD